MYDITILQIYNYFFKSSSSFDEIGVHLRLGVTQNGVHLNLQWSQIFLTSKAIFEPKLEFRVSYKGGSKMDPPFGSFENERNEMDPLNKS